MNPGQSYTTYARTEVIAVPTGDPAPGKEYTSDICWNAGPDRVIQWVSEQPEGTLFRCVAWTPGENA